MKDGQIKFLGLNLCYKKYLKSEPHLKIHKLSELYTNDVLNS